MKKIRIYVGMLIAAMVATAIILSCNKDKLNTINGNVVATTDYFKTSGQLQEAVNATYGT